MTSPKGGCPMMIAPSGADTRAIPPFLCEPGCIKKRASPDISPSPGVSRRSSPAMERVQPQFWMLFNTESSDAPRSRKQVSSLSSTSAHVTACTAEAVPRCNVSRWRAQVGRFSNLISQHGFNFTALSEVPDSTDYRVPYPIPDARFRRSGPAS
jgi:hypothetical protein